MNPKWEDCLVLNRDEIQRDTVMLEVRTFSETSENNPLIGVGFIPFTPALLLKKINKTVDLYHDGNFAGSVTVDYEFVTDQDEKYKEI